MVFDLFDRAIGRLVRLMMGSIEWVLVLGAIVLLAMKAPGFLMVGAGFWGILCLVRIHYRQWGTPTAPPLVKVTFGYVTILFGLFLLAQLPLPLPVWRFALWASLGYGGVVLYLDGTSVQRNGPPALVRQNQEVRHATLFDFLR